MPRLENWSVVQGINPYLAPDVQPAFLQGIVYDHGHLKDGEHILTSALVEFDLIKASAKTYSGSNYSLGKPDAKWLEWLEENDQTEFIDELKRLTSKFLN